MFRWVGVVTQQGGAAGLEHPEDPLQEHPPEAIAVGRAAPGRANARANAQHALMQAFVLAKDQGEQVQVGED